MSGAETTASIAREASAGGLRILGSIRKVEIILTGKKPAELIASQTGVTIVECAMFPGAQSEVTDYFTIFDNAVCRLTTAFDG